MIEVNGKYASAKIFTAQVEKYALAQIKLICDNAVSAGSKICIMPDVHPGKVGTIGLTMTVGERIMPNLVGIDIGCGMTLAKLKCKKAEYQKLDSVIRQQIPSGFGIRKTPHRCSSEFDFSKLRCGLHVQMEKAVRSLGTLGRGNHFIEIDKDSRGNLYAVIHSGSRHLGKEVTEYYLKKGQELLKSKGLAIPYELTYLEDGLMEDYLYDLQRVQEFAALNRRAILDALLKGMKWKTDEVTDCIHNYVEEENGCRILRKGAISAKKDETVVIPVNMRDGILLGTGKGNPDWNYSAPHGAGRILKREEVKNHYTVSSFKAEMKGIYSTCIRKDTLDEAPFAYRNLGDIMENIEETAAVADILKPLYNFKAGGNE